MGSKTSMLQAGLSGIISENLGLRPPRFVDLFAGSGAVARWVAENHDVPVDAVDTQLYGKLLSGVIIERHEKASASILNDWIVASRDLHSKRSSGLRPTDDRTLNSDAVYLEREEAEQIRFPGFVARQYGGHYYSINQGIALDCLLECLPSDGPERLVALAAVIETASSCAASPGHTAQPFQPTGNLLRHIGDAWRRDPFIFVSRKSDMFARRFALARGGKAFQQDALLHAQNNIEDGSVVFCDPPYSEVQYSRFYHVLEGIARGGWDRVYGAGRAPQGAERFSSRFSSRKDSTSAFTELFRLLAARSTTVLMTFPNHACSNGQSAESLIALAEGWFKVSSTAVDVIHSSLGASQVSGGNRVPRRGVEESVIVLKPLS
ncbi:DNA adenine methylase [Arthrobacter sp. zg-Y877]|uniref:DNA adenine methylase n=1 Tax=Arthrobacter sp. zg-Y877 TaxID=3049074 RepID=UPI0025A3D93E|nr:DNA adenine methylase [Arthrobacter sp. zg-Y877]MDM7990710.1 DNA adenine methylase [Arthrobacter sp. zg-Y877]